MESRKNEWEGGEGGKKRGKEEKKGKLRNKTRQGGPKGRKEGGLGGQYRKQQRVSRPNHTDNGKGNTMKLFVRHSRKQADAHAMALVSRAGSGGRDGWRKSRDE